MSHRKYYIPRFRNFGPKIEINGSDNIGTTIPNRNIAVHRIRDSIFIFNRSDVFPFLDRVTYLCLGEVVYTGATQFMLDYFRNIGFPCPEYENPLMYYRK